MRNDHAKHVEVGDRLKRGGQRRQEFVKVSVTTDQVDHTCERHDITSEPTAGLPPVPVGVCDGQHRSLTPGAHERQSLPHREPADEVTAAPGLA